MARNVYRGAGTEAPQNGTLRFSKGTDGAWKIAFSPNADGLRYARHLDPNFVAPSGPIVLVDCEPGRAKLNIYPKNLTKSHGLFGGKYPTLSIIRFEGMTTLRAPDMEEANWVLGRLGDGFVRSPEFGLGIDKELDPIVEALETAKVSTLVIRSGSRKGLPKLSGTEYTMAAVQFQEMRRGLRAIHSHHLRHSSEDKWIEAHNGLLTEVDPIKFPAEPPVYRKDGVARIMTSRSGEELSKIDQKAVLSAASGAAKAMIKANPSVVMELRREVELVTLHQLVHRMRDLISKGTNEGGWQKFFEANPFVLRLAFGFPVVQMGGQISVGGGKFNGTGGKISDFALKALKTGNLVLVEIKTHKTDLLEKAEYRGGVYAPHKELAGAVNQVLDQRYQLQKNLPQLKDSSGNYDVESYAIQCVVVAGTAPTEKDKLKSLELFRNSLKSVTVITFDEMLAKLDDLIEFLQPPTLITPA